MQGNKTIVLALSRQITHSLPLSVIGVLLVGLSAYADEDDADIWLESAS